MKLVYAYGAGFGHLNRIQRYLAYRGIAMTEVVLLTNSQYVDQLSEAYTVLQYPDTIFQDQSAFVTMFKECLSTTTIDEIIVDVFPSGFYGELAILDQIAIPKTLLARIVKPSYFESFRSPHYNTLVELEDGILLASYAYASKQRLSLAPIIPTPKELQLDAPFFLVLHSGPEAEVMQLYKLAKQYQKQEEHIYIQTFCNTLPLEGDKTTLISSEPPIAVLLEQSDKLFTACGFNVFWGTQAYRHKQHFLPFKRRYDDQFKRKSIHQKPVP